VLTTSSESYHAGSSPTLAEFRVCALSFGTCPLQVTISTEGTVAVRYMSETTLNLAVTPLNLTAVVPVSLLLKMPTDLARLARLLADA